MIKLYKQIWKILLLLAGCLLFVVGGYFMIIDTENSWFEILIGYLALVFFGIGIPISLYYLLDFRAQIIITETYFHDRMSRVKFEWGELEDCTIYDEISGVRLLSLKLNVSKKRNIIYRFFEKINIAFGAYPTNVNISFINVNPDKLVDLISLLNRIEAGRRLETIRLFKDRLRYK